MTKTESLRLESSCSAGIKVERFTIKYQTILHNSRLNLHMAAYSFIHTMHSLYTHSLHRDKHEDTHKVRYTILIKYWCDMNSISLLRGLDGQTEQPTTRTTSDWLVPLPGPPDSPLLPLMGFRYQVLEVRAMASLAYSSSDTEHGERLSLPVTFTRVKCANKRLLCVCVCVCV